VKKARRCAALAAFAVMLAAAGCTETLIGPDENENDNPPAVIQESDVPMENGLASAHTETAPAFDIVRAMGVGWNLGNTLDSIDNQKWGISKEITFTTPERYYETCWGNPVTTAENIAAVAKAGFGAIRVPVTFSDHMDEDFKIRREWLLRVEQVVKYVLENDMYCIINIHHDTGHGSWPWLKADSGNLAKLERQLRTVWLQIAAHFADYGDKLIFESFNEILDIQDRWSGSDSASYTAVNRLNQVFVDAVRSTGHNNANRFLIVKTYAASTEEDALDAFALPKDSVADRLIVGVHYYGTVAFVMHQSQVGWTEAYTDWSPVRDGRPVEKALKQLNGRFVEKGIPVIVSEFGAQNKGNTADRAKYAAHYVITAKQFGIACFWWDTGGQAENADSVDSTTLLDRAGNKWYFPEIVDAMVKAAK